MASSTQAGNNNDLVVVESDPKGRYVRYNKILGEGATKKVYLAFDGFNGMEVAWSKTQLPNEKFIRKEILESLCAEPILLKSLEHENIVKCYDSWIDEDNKIIHMITELLNSGNLNQYIRKHDKLIDVKAIKEWARQILQGLHYLHTRRPPIIHSDIKCDNVFVNGNTGGVKLGDFGFSFICDQVISGLENTKDHQMYDIYNFGLCIQNMVVLQGEKPRHKFIEIKKFVEKCLASVSKGPLVFDLLNDPVLAPSISETLTASSSLSLREAVANDVARLLRKKFKLQGRMKDNVSISMAFWIIFHRKVEKITFVEFSIETDKIPVVMQKLATDNGLSTDEVRLVSELMEKLITALTSSDRPCPTIELLR